MTARTQIDRAARETDLAIRALEGEPGMRAAQARAALQGAATGLRQAAAFLDAGASGLMQAIRSDADELPR